MPTDVDAISKLSREIATLSKEFEDGKTPQKSVQDALVSAAEKLAIATRDPDENMYYIASQVITLKPFTILRKLNTTSRLPTMRLFAASSPWEFSMKSPLTVVESAQKTWLRA